MYRRLIPILFLILLTLSSNTWADFTGTNQSDHASDFSFQVGVDVTSITLTVSGDVEAWSHLLLKKGSAPTDEDYDFISQNDYQDNSIHMELPEISEGTWHLKVRTPAVSSEHNFTVQVLTQTASVQPQSFQSSGELNSGEWHYYRVEIPENSPGWRMVLNSVGNHAAGLYVRKDLLPTTGAYLKQVNYETNATLILTESEATAGVYYVGVYQPYESSSYQLYSEVGYLTTLQWDPGTTHLGTEVFTNSSQTGGSYYFKISAEATTAGAWRTALNVQSGEAELYMLQGSLPGNYYYQYKSDQVGSDGFVLNSWYYSPGQEWFIMVTATPGSQWNLVTGEAYVQDLGQLTADGSSSSGEVAIGAEGMRFFKTTAPVDTHAWRLWLENGVSNNIYVKKGTVPLPDYYDLVQAKQMLVVPSYLDGTGVEYFVSVAGTPGTMINLDSRQQPILDLDFGDFDTQTITGFGYVTYRVQVPVEQVAWQVKLSQPEGNASVALRRDFVPNEWNNNAFSEVEGVADESITMVPPTLSDGTFYITVYGTDPYTFTLENGNPVITDVAFTSTTVNDDPDRTGWRYYRITDISSQLGCLGWELLLDDQVPGTEIALRRNAVPSRWHYRENGGTYDHSGHVDYSGIGFLQRPGHQADIWYVGVYSPYAALGSFELTAQLMNAEAMNFDGVSVNAVDQPGGKWRYFKVVVPANTMGWDLRLVDVTGSPQLALSRDRLPGSEGGSAWPWPYYAPGCTVWPSGCQWSAGADWTNRYSDPTGTIDESGRILAMGMGNPLEPGTYYVGVGNSWYSAPVSYTLLSRGIGDGMTIPIVDVAFNGGTASAEDVAPREAAYYRVTIPEGTPSWQARLSPTTGEALMQILYQKIPNINTWDLFYAGGQKMQKNGKEQWVLLPNPGEDFITAGTYYIAVVSEGQNPSDWPYIGVAESSWTFESQGVMDIHDMGTTGAVDLVEADSLEGGAAKAYQFTVLEGTSSIEVRLQNQMGIPMLKLVQGEHLPGINVSSYGNDYYGNYGGEYYALWHSDLITVPNPVPGVYSVVVNASDGSSGAGEDASYTLRVTNGGIAQIAFDGGISAVSGQESGTWNYYKMIVPDTADGWDLRLVNVTSGSPTLVVRRDLLPEWGLNNANWPWPYYPSGCTEWPSGCQWQAGNDWTNRSYDSTGTFYEGNRSLAMGMGNPLEPGLYYIAVGNPDWNSEPLSYTLQSRGIGDGMMIPIVDVPFEGSITADNILPHEAVYYRVTIPENTPSWQARLVPTVGEALMQIMWQKIPNVGTYDLYYAAGQRMQKTDKEQWVLLPNSGEDIIAAGEYYIAVASEGMEPINPSCIGYGDSSWTFESQGVMEINDLGTVGMTDLVQDDSLEGGAAKAYQFTVPEGASSIEVRLQNRVGIPMLKLVQGEHLPSLTPSGYGNDSYGNYGGEYNAFWHADLIIVPNPVPGVYSVIVNASDGGSGAGENASYTLRITGAGVAQVDFDGGSRNINAQEPGTWNFFQVEVPANAVGWDIRLTDVTGSPSLIVRRDFLPDEINGGLQWPWPYNAAGNTTWPSGCQWYAANDWTNRYLDPTGVIYEYGHILAMGMGNPLEPGTYYVGVGNSYTPTPMSYTLLSRGIGDGMTIPVIDVPFDGGMAAAENIAPREAVYYRVTIPEGTRSWQARLSPTIGEAMMQVQKQKLPNIQASWANPYEYGGKRMQKTDKEQWVLLPDSGEEFIPAGAYYAAVVSEGQDPIGSECIGTGESSWTFESQGVMDINNLGTIGVIDLIQADALEGGAAKAYQFTVPEGTLSVEVRLQNRIGMPMLKLVQGENLPSIPYYGNDYYGNYGGQNITYWHSDIVTVPNPVPGVYSLIVNASDGSYGAGQSASYTLNVHKHAVTEINFTESQNTNGLPNIASGELADQQSAFYKVIVPEEVDGGPVVGWRLKLSTTQGVASVRVKQDVLPDSSYETMPFKAGDALITPPFLTSGTWYVEVKGAGNTDYTLTSLNFETERPAWEMPLMGDPVTTPGLEGTSCLGDSGVEPDGIPLLGDQGIDLENGSYHYYAVTVPEDNAVLIRTMLEAISGNPDLYIRVGLPPTNDHNAEGASGVQLYDRTLTGTATEYGNWVPMDGRADSYLKGGTWYFAVHAASDTNCRYRLRISAGDVQDLTLNGGSYSGQILAAKDWRYYKVSVPIDAPANWNVTFSQQSGDVIMHVRDTSPPGNNYNAEVYIDWGNYYGNLDSKNDGPYSYYDSPGTYSFGVQPLRPGHTYYLGFRAVTDASFSVSSTTSGGVFADPIVVPFYGGSQNVVIDPYSSAVFRFDVPEDAGNWTLNNTHSSDVVVYLEQGTMPYLDNRADWQSYGDNSSFYLNLVPGGWPWLPGHSYYMVAVNNSASAQSFGVSSQGEGYPADLAVTISDSPDPVQVGQNVTYTLTVSNSIDRPAANVVLTNWLPENMSFVSATSTIGTCSGTDVVVCNIGTLPQGQTATVTIVARAMSSGVFNDTATVSSDTPENYSYNNTDWETTIAVPSSPTYSGGSGTVDDPYLIANAEDLYCVRYNLSKCFRQVADVYLYNPWNLDQGWQPIGYYNNASDFAPFRGTYNGDNYVIHYLTMNRPGTDFVGLFGYTYAANLNHIRLYQSNVTGRDYAGSLVGWQSGGSITRCSAESWNYVYGGNNVGGLVGQSINGILTKSFSSGGAQGLMYVGGFVGSNISSDIDNCYTNSMSSATISYAGGLVGYNNASTVTNCYSNGYVYGDGGYIGGLIGYNSGGTVTQSYWDMEQTGLFSSAGGLGKTTAQMKKQAIYFGWDFNSIWGIQEDTTYPYFQAELTYEPVSILDAKKSTEDRPVQIDAAIVSAAWSNSLYIVDDLGVAGIRVEKFGHGISNFNTRATVKGIVKTSPECERYIEASSVDYAGSGSVRPVGMPARSLGGAASLDSVTGFGQQGVYGSNGVNNIGLLVRVWGRVVEVESVPAPMAPSWFKIDDGSGRIIKCVVEDDNPVIDPLWQDSFAVVTGISSCEFEDGNLISKIRLKKDVIPTLY